MFLFFFFFSSRRRHTRLVSDWSSDVCSSDLENQDQASFCPSAPREVSVLPELALGHLRYRLTGVPPQSNSPPGTVPGAGRARPARGRALGARSESPSGLAPPPHRVSEKTRSE